MKLASKRFGSRARQLGLIWRMTGLHCAALAISDAAALRPCAEQSSPQQQMSAGPADNCK